MDSIVSGFKIHFKFLEFSFQVTTAAEQGAKGALLYPDPIYFSLEGQSEKDTYPNTVWSSRDAIYEKPLRHMYGDPLTPELPSIPGMYRRPLNETGLPSIPSQPISYKDAMYLLSRINGKYTICRTMINSCYWKIHEKVFRSQFLKTFQNF